MSRTLSIRVCRHPPPGSQLLALEICTIHGQAPLDTRPESYLLRWWHVAGSHVHVSCGVAGTGTPQSPGETAQSAPR